MPFVSPVMVCVVTVESKVRAGCAVVPVYGVTGLFIAIDDIRMHGKDERILITAFDQGLDFTYDFLKRLTK